MEINFFAPLDPESLCPPSFPWKQYTDDQEVIMHTPAVFLSAPVHFLGSGAWKRDTTTALTREGFVVVQSRTDETLYMRHAVTTTEAVVGRGFATLMASDHMISHPNPGIYSLAECALALELGLSVAVNTNLTRTGLERHSPLLERTITSLAADTHSVWETINKHAATIRRLFGIHYEDLRPKYNLETIQSLQTTSYWQYLTTYFNNHILGDMTLAWIRTRLGQPLNDYNFPTLQTSESRGKTRLAIGTIDNRPQLVHVFSHSELYGHTIEFKFESPLGTQAQHCVATGLDEDGELVYTTTPPTMFQKWSERGTP